MNSTPLSLVVFSGLISLSSAAVVTNGFVQNRVNNWSHLSGAVASQSSLQAGGVASRAIDGNYSGAWGDGSVTHTDNAEANGWWQVDLGGVRPISDVTIYNRTDCCGGRLSNYSIVASNDPSFATTVYSSGTQSSAPAVSESFSSLGVMARYVRVQRDADPAGLAAGNNAISLAEVDVLGQSFSYTNLAIGSTATQSSTLVNGANPIASKAIDGDLSTSFGDGSTTHTATGGSTPVYWETTLASLADINEIALFNRGDCCPDRLSNFRLSIFDGATEVWGQDYFTSSGFAGDDNPDRIFSVQEDLGGFVGRGDRVRIELIGGTNNGANGTDVLSLREVEIYGLAVPEPGTTGLILLSVLGMLRRRR